MAQLCVTDDAKANLRQKKKEYAELRGLNEHQVSDTDTLIWLCESQPKSKDDRFRVIFDKFKQDTLTIAGPLHDDKSLNVMLELMNIMLRSSFEDQGKMADYPEELKGVIDRVAAKHPLKIPGMKKRSIDDARQRSPVD